MIGDHIAAVLWAVAPRTCSILPTTFFCNYRQAFSPYVYCIHTAVSTRLLLGKKLRFILSVRSDFHMKESLLIAVHAFASCMWCLIYETLLPRLVNLSNSFRDLSFSMKMSPFWLKHMYSVLSALTRRPMPAAARSRPCSNVSTWAVIFSRSDMSSA